MNAWWCLIHPVLAARQIISLSNRNRGLEQNNKERERQNERLKYQQATLVRDALIGVLDEVRKDAYERGRTDEKSDKDRPAHPSSADIVKQIYANQGTPIGSFGLDAKGNPNVERTPETE